MLWWSFYFAKLLLQRYAEDLFVFASPSLSDVAGRPRLRFTVLPTEWIGSSCNGGMSRDASDVGWCWFAVLSLIEVVGATFALEPSRLEPFLGVR
ncbi:hypothetical protein Nepgr_017400 [Nepenthes gracilis]|uniref:Secreted protein n=1 Tax=Nepenthes gracilis TaxID=150966 RepID=A0AAD3SRD4_NEPGR|nr:hypothetical protein Nepgr_017400 [Nepenthes gracilis]